MREAGANDPVQQLYAKPDCPAVWNSPKTSASVLLFAEGYF